MLSHLYRSTIVVKTISGVDFYNKPTISSTANVTCYIKEGIKVVKNKEGKEVVSSARIHTDVAIDDNSLIVLNGQDREILFVATLRDLQGNIDHYETYI